MNFETKDSGAREEFKTGSVRDTQQGKARWDLMPWEELERVADLYARGAEKYGDDNWRKGQPMKRTFASLMRHIIAYSLGKRDEDHGAAVIWNMLSLMWHETNRPDLNDLYGGKQDGTA